MISEYMTIETILKCIIVCEPAAIEHNQISNNTHIHHCSRSVGQQNTQVHSSTV